ncbi:MAG: YqeB family protein, partial [Pseudonocardiaceae bacterium]
MASTIPDRVSMPVGYLWLLRLGCPLVGFGLGFAIGPFVRWVAIGPFVRWVSSILQSAPAPLRLAAEIPTPWLVPILTVIGIGAGYWLAQHAERGTHDPHEADYRRWIDGHPDLDHPTNALLRARRKALGSGNRV